MFVSFFDTIYQTSSSSSHMKHVSPTTHIRYDNDFFVRNRLWIPVRIAHAFWIRNSDETVRKSRNCATVDSIVDFIAEIRMSKLQFFLLTIICLAMVLTTTTTRRYKPFRTYMVFCSCFIFELALFSIECILHSILCPFQPSGWSYCCGEFCQLQTANKQSNADDANGLPPNIVNE